MQSVSVRLIVEKEKSIKDFQSKSTYNIFGDFLTAKSDLFPAMMLGEVKLKKTAKQLLQSFIESTFTVSSIKNKPSKSTSSSPFTTSSLQQSASNKLGFSVSKTMTVAQRLYESGHITYMRTDSTNLSKDALSNMEKYIVDTYGKEYAKKTIYTTKTKVAQEAHEAIRPTDFYNINCGNDEAQKKLYRLIWESTICSQMSDAIFDKTIVDVNVSNLEK